MNSTLVLTAFFLCLSGLLLARLPLRSKLRPLLRSAR